MQKKTQKTELVGMSPKVGYYYSRSRFFQHEHQTSKHQNININHTGGETRERTLTNLSVYRRYLSSLFLNPWTLAEHWSGLMLMMTFWRNSQVYLTARGYSRLRQ